MKFITIGFFIFWLSACCLGMSKEEGMELMESLLAACKIEEGGSDADVETIKNLTYPTSSEGKCMVACAHEKVGIIKDNIFQRKVFILIIKMATDGHDRHEEYVKLADELADSCGNIGGSDRCEVAIEFDKCLEKELKSKGVELPFI